MAAALVRVAAAFADRLKSAGLDPGRLLATAVGAADVKALGEQLAFRARFEAALREVMEALGPRHLTVIIDDLDRCRPDQVAEVMEAVNFLAGAGGCFIVLGIDREKVLTAMGLAHREMAREFAPPGETDERRIRALYAEHYLAKLIQMEIPVPRFDADAARRLSAAAARPDGGPRPERAWLPAAIGLGVLLYVAAFFGAGYWTAQWLEGSAPPAPAAEGRPGPAESAPARLCAQSPEPRPVDRPPVPSSSMPADDRPIVIIPTPAPPPAWWWLAVLPILVLLGLAAWLQWRRPSLALVEEDTPQFARALEVWAEAAFLARPNPREMKRFLNRLRFANTGRETPDGPTMVGLAVLAHKDRRRVEAFRDGRIGLEELTGTSGNDADDFAEAVKRAMNALRSNGLPAFRPSPADARAFLAAWTAVTVRA